MTRRPALPTLAVAILAMSGVSAFAQAPQVPGNSDLRSMYSPDAIVDNASSHMARRYNLTPQQNESLRGWMRAGVDRLLTKHVSAFRGLILEFIAYRLAGRTPTTDKAAEWARRAEPIIRDVQLEIIDLNNRFHETLDAEQKKLHTQDVKAMSQVFEALDKKVERWKAGGFKPEEWSPPRQPAQAPAARQPTPKPRVQASEPMSPRHRFWKRFTSTFTRDHALDAAQQNNAWTVYNDVVARSRALETKHAAAARELDNAIQTARELGDPELMRTLLERRQKLFAQHDALFDELKNRLQALPTPQQRERFLRVMQARAKSLNEQRSAVIADRRRASDREPPAGPLPPRRECSPTTQPSR